MTCPICRAQLPQRPNRSPARRRRGLSSEGCFYICLPDDWHNRDGRPRLGRLAVFRCAGDVRPQLRELQRSTAARQDDGAASLRRHAKAVLRLFFDHALGPGPMVLDDRLVQPVLGGNHMAVMHATMCAAACAALREPGFRVLDREPGVLPGVSYSPGTAQQELAALEDAWFAQIFGGLLMPSFTAAQMLEGIPQLGAEAVQLNSALESRGAGAHGVPTSAEDFRAALNANSIGLGLGLGLDAPPLWQPRLDGDEDPDLLYEDEDGDEVVVVRAELDDDADADGDGNGNGGGGGGGPWVVRRGAAARWRRLFGPSAACRLLALGCALGALCGSLPLGRALFGPDGGLVPLGALGAGGVAFLALLAARCIEAELDGQLNPIDPSVDSFWPERRWPRAAALALVAGLVALLGTAVSLVVAACVGALPVGGMVYSVTYEVARDLARRPRALNLRGQIATGLLSCVLGLTLGVLLRDDGGPRVFHEARAYVFGGASQVAAMA